MRHGREHEPLCLGVIWITFLFFTYSLFNLPPRHVSVLHFMVLCHCYSLLRLCTPNLFFGTCKNFYCYYCIGAFISRQHLQPLGEPWPAHTSKTAPSLFTPTATKVLSDLLWSMPPQNGLREQFVVFKFCCDVAETVTPP